MRPLLRFTRTLRLATAAATIGSLLAVPLATAASAASPTVSVGGTPAGVAVNPSTNTVYVTNFNDNTVSVIDGSNNTVTATVTVGSTPWGVAVNPSTNTVYVTNSNDNTVSVIDGSNNTVTATVSVGSAPYGVAVNPSTNTVYVTNLYDNTVSVIDGSNNTVTATVSVGGTPPGVAVNPSTNTVYVTNSTDNTVSVIDGSNNTVTATVSVGSTPWGVAVNPSTNTVYVTNGGSNSVSVITPVPFAPTVTSATGGSSQATVTWTDGASNGSAITSQTIYVYAGSTLEATKTDCSGSPCTVTGLTNGTSYTFKVSDTNGVGEGALSSASGSVIPLPVPTLSRVMPGDGLLVPHWSGVTIAHGTVLHFTATAFDLSGNVAGKCRTSGSGRRCRITGLTAHVAYQVTVTATAGIGTKATGFSVVTSAPSNKYGGVPLAPKMRG